jgi:mannose-1-phosphate guanylyltransferase
MRAKVGEQDANWALILAGGEGSRLRALTRQIAGYELPKQFCRLIGGDTLLEQTHRRVSLVIEEARMVTVVTRPHERFYAPILAGTPAEQIVVQPQNRGTAPAILYALARMAKVDMNGRVAILPSDHYVNSDEAFMRHVEAAFRAVSARPELVVLLGIRPSAPESAYGWIEPADLIPGTELLRVRRFWEKPSSEMATSFWRAGFLWNSFVMVARVSTLLELLRTTIPELYASFEKISSDLGTANEQRAVETLYAKLGAVSFSDEVLAKAPTSLAVLPVNGVEWSDLGEPRRVFEVLEREGMDGQWVAA